MRRASIREYPLLFKNKRKQSIYEGLYAKRQIVWLCLCINAKMVSALVMIMQTFSTRFVQGCTKFRYGVTSASMGILEAAQDLLVLGAFR